MFGDGQHVLKDGRAWRLGTSAEAAWINDGTLGRFDDHVRDPADF